MKKNLLLSIFTVLSLAAAITYSPVGADTYNHTECPRVDPLYYTVMLPNPEDCGTYFVCSKGVPILERCPDGLHWNDKLKCCDWPEYAGCVDGTGVDGDQREDGDGQFLKDYYLGCPGGGVETGTFQKNGSITILGNTISGSKGQVYVIVWERRECVPGVGMTCDTSRVGVFVTSSSVG